MKKKWTQKQKFDIAAETIWLGTEPTVKRYMVKRDILFQLRRTYIGPNEKCSLCHYNFIEPETVYLRKENNRLEKYLADFAVRIEDLFPKTVFDLLKISNDIPGANPDFISYT